MPIIKDLTPPAARLTPVFLIEDICFPSKKEKTQQIGTINTVLSAIKETRPLRAEIVIGELRIGERLQWTSPSLISLENYQYTPPEIETAPVFEPVFNQCPEELNTKLSRSALFCNTISPAGWYTPIFFFFFNTRSALDAFLSNYTPLIQNKWYQYAMNNNQIVLTYADSCLADKSTEELLDGMSIIAPRSPVDEFFCSFRPSMFELHFKYSMIDDEKTRKSLSLPFRRFQSGGRDSFVLNLHQQEPEYINKPDKAFTFGFGGEFDDTFFGDLD